MASDWSNHGQDGICSHAVPTTNDLLAGSHHRSPLGLFFPLFYMSSIRTVIDWLLSFIYPSLQQQCFFFKQRRWKKSRSPVLMVMENLFSRKSSDLIIVLFLVAIYQYGTVSWRSKKWCVPSVLQLMPSLPFYYMLQAVQYKMYSRGHRWVK